MNQQRPNQVEITVQYYFIQYDSAVLNPLTANHLLLIVFTRSVRNTF